MENSPQCMIYIPWKTDSMNEDTILFGDDQGMCEKKVVWEESSVWYPGDGRFCYCASEFSS